MAQTPPGAPPGVTTGVFPPFDAATFPSQLFWFTLTFGLLYYLMAYVALPRVAGIIEERGKRIAADLQEAQRLRAESEAAGAAYEKSLAEARGKAKAIAQETRDALHGESEARRKVLEAELADRIAHSEEAISATTAQAMASVRGIAADTATAIVERLTGEAPARETVEAALDRVGT
ncbi:MAG TPA: F0F1 ATP synthase subunit B' [Beijerinckiaceae bacterium]|nr:F0F1 ATP synthase subunit B' [Beijerinckiaceae bacterium]